MGQLFALTRNCSLLDVICNTAGAVAGVLLAATFPAAISEAVHGAEAAGAFRLSGVVALLYLWAGYQLFPFFPSTGLYALRSKLALLLSSGTWPARGAFESLAGWLAISALLEYLFGPRRMGPFLGIASWMIFRKLARPMLYSGLLALGAIVAAGLVPFRFAPVPQRFTWVPFLPMLQTQWESALVILPQKSFLYGSAVWLLNDGFGWMMSSLIVAAPLAFVEGIQVFLPGRTPEVTDPLLAWMLGLGLMFLERHAQRSQFDLKTRKLDSPDKTAA